MNYGPTEAQRAFAQREVDEWNGQHPPGTAVTFRRHFNQSISEALKTRTKGEAFETNGRAVIFLESKGGYVALNHVDFRVVDEEEVCLSQLQA